MIELRPVEEETLDELFEVGRDREIWRLTSVDYSDPAVFYPNFRAALNDRALGKAYPFLVCLRDGGRVIGTTRLLDIHPQDKKIEIGVTWIASEFWGSGVNAECKQILLAYCFDVLGVNRVQFRAKARQCPLTSRPGKNRCSVRRRHAQGQNRSQWPGSRYGLLQHRAR